MDNSSDDSSEGSSNKSLEDFLKDFSTKKEISEISFRDKNEEYSSVDFSKASPAKPFKPFSGCSTSKEEMHVPV